MDPFNHKQMQAALLTLMIIPFLAGMTAQGVIDHIVSIMLKH